MTKLKGLTVGDLQVELRDRNRPSLKQFDDLIQDYLIHLAETQHLLQSSWACFKRKDEDILPVQCKRAINSLEVLSEHVQEFCEFFHETAKLPVVYIALRYRLISVLYLIEERSSELIDLIDSYREVCMMSTSDVRQQRLEINDVFEVLLQHIDDIFQRARILRDEAPFQERQLTSKLEEKPSPDANSKKNSSTDKHPLYVVKKHVFEIESAKEEKTSSGERGATANILRLRSSS